MVDGEAVLATLAESGITLELTEGRIQIHGGTLHGELRDLVVINKSAVVKALREREISGHCGIVQPPETAAVPEPVRVEAPASPSPSSADTSSVSEDVSDQEWAEDRLWDLYKAIGDGSARGLNIQVPKVAKVHLEAARAHVEALRALGPAAVMAACVANYKAGVEALKAQGVDTFVLRASLALSASYRDNKPKFSPWYQKMLDESDASKVAGRQIELGHDKHVSAHDEEVGA